MIKPTINPTLYQVNTRIWLTDLAHKLGQPAGLDDIADADLDWLAGQGFDWVWFLGIWQTGPAGQNISRSRPEWQKEFQETLPDLREDDIAGSCFAITSYTVPAGLGGNEALLRLRQRLHQRGLKLMLDFVPNHTALDHPWTEQHPDYFVPGSETDLAQDPANFCKIATSRGPLILAHGRDPYFPGWPDTLQLNYGNPGLQETMIEELFMVAGLCDGVRCDMAMLILPEVFERTWKIPTMSFWPRAIEKIRREHPQFLFLAEVYWDLEWTLQQQGFDYTYDKRLYDYLREGSARPVREHFWANLDYQKKLARFLENHDEPRATVTFPSDVHQAAAIITFLSTGLRFFHQGQFEGFTKHVSTHLVRQPVEPVNQDLQAFYDQLLRVLREPIFRQGVWGLLECVPAWAGNVSWDCFLAYAWEGDDHQRMLIAVNFAPYRSQCFVRLPFQDLTDNNFRFQDMFHEVAYDRDGTNLALRGLYLDMPPWAYHVFRITRLP